GDERLDRLSHRELLPRCASRRGRRVRRSVLRTSRQQKAGEGARMSTADLPVAVIGGGPVGLAAAAHLITRNIPVKLYESGDTIAANVRDWGHVRLFSPWSFNTDQAAKAILKRHGWQEPRGDGMPTGGDLYEAYLRPLADTPEMRAVIDTKTAVKAISRQGIGKVV